MHKLLSLLENRYRIAYGKETQRIITHAEQVVKGSVH